AQWAFQVSFGELREPEQLDPGVDVARTTASAIYHRHWDDGDWQTTLAVGRNDKQPGDESDAYLVESTLTLSRKNTWIARFERVEKDELFSAPSPLAGESFAIEKLSLGFEREVAVIGSISLAAGVLGSAYWFDSALDPFYGDAPTSFMLFLRGRL